MKLIITAFFVLCLFRSGIGYKYTFGHCPKIRAIENFDITKFLGTWYIVEGNDKEISCAKIEIEGIEDKITNSTKYTIEESGNVRYLMFVKHYFSRIGRIEFPQPDVRANLKVVWHWTSPFENLIVFDTDYENYAGVLFCSNALMTSQTRTFVLSRSTNATMEHSDVVKKSLKLNQHNVEELSKIYHEDCSTKDSLNTLKLTVNQNSLSPKEMGKKLENMWNKNFEKSNCNVAESTEETTKSTSN